MVAASAVRKAVSSSALMRPTALPVLSKSVREPRGVVLCELAIGGLGVNVLLLSVEAAEEETVGEVAESVTTFIPMLVLVVAGINSVVCLSLKEMDVL